VGGDTNKVKKNEEFSCRPVTILQISVLLGVYAQRFAAKGFAFNLLKPFFTLHVFVLRPQEYYRPL
jgi:hypothetical protein